MNTRGRGAPSTVRKLPTATRCSPSGLTSKWKTCAELLLGSRPPTEWLRYGVGLPVIGFSDTIRFVNVPDTIS